jgi:acetate kinase
MQLDGDSSVKPVILCINSGSSSLKFALYRFAQMEERLIYGAVERIGLHNGRLWIKGSGDISLADVHEDFSGHSAAAAGIFAATKNLGLPQPLAAGHRVVHGGPNRSSSQRVNGLLLSGLRKLIPFAPLHMPSAIQAIAAIAERFPSLPQVACFDTAFHRRMPQVAQRPSLRSVGRRYPAVWLSRSVL